jgi:quercetin dioxygenase-like cupin family protein
MSPAFLSLFETGKSDISFARLVRLVAFFRIRLSDLFPDPDPFEITIIRPDTRRRIASPSEHALLDLLTDGTNDQLGAALITLDAGGTIDPVPPTPWRTSFMFMLRGAIELDDGLRPPMRLAAGDSTCFGEDHGRYVRNVGDERAELIVVTTPLTL